MRIVQTIRLRAARACAVELHWVEDEALEGGLSGGRRGAKPSDGSRLRVCLPVRGTRPSVPTLPLDATVVAPRTTWLATCRGPRGSPCQKPPRAALDTELPRCGAHARGRSAGRERHSWVPPRPLNPCLQPFNEEADVASVSARTPYAAMSGSVGGCRDGQARPHPGQQAAVA